jgi:hypothetical protein
MHSTKGGALERMSINDTAFTNMLAASDIDCVTVPDGWSLRASLKASPIDWERLDPDLVRAGISSLPLSMRARIRWR